MKKVLVLGAGLVSRPLVRYLLERGFEVTVATRTVEKAKVLIEGYAHGKAVPVAATDSAALEPLVRAHDLSVSLLPAPLHPVVAELCIKHGKHMVTTSYVSPAMRAMDGRAKAAGVVLLNEIGVDPGIDHMSAMRIIHDVKRRGGKVTSFKSYCGGLPAPEANTNPFGYKFSWSPRSVCTAGKNAARYREKGKEVQIPGPDLFACRHDVAVPGFGKLVGYPNRDSLIYEELYGLVGIPTMFRGTLRYPGWCETLKAIVDLGLLDESPVTYPAGMTYAEWMEGFVKSGSNGDVKAQVAAQLKLAAGDPIIERLSWLGLFSADKITPAGEPTTALDVLAKRMEKMMPYAPGERDMIVLIHEFEAELPGGKREAISSTLLDYGIPNGDSSMARTVSLPAAVGVRLILEGKLTSPGVHIPVIPEIYEPVLNELAEMNIRCEEKTRAL